MRFFLPGILAPTRQWPQDLRLMRKGKKRRKKNVHHPVSSLAWTPACDLAAPSASLSLAFCRTTTPTSHLNRHLSTSFPIILAPRTSFPVFIPQRTHLSVLRWTETRETFQKGEQLEIPPWRQTLVTFIPHWLKTLQAVYLKCPARWDESVRLWRLYDVMCRAMTRVCALAPTTVFHHQAPGGAVTRCQLASYNTRDGNNSHHCVVGVTRCDVISLKKMRMRKVRQQGKKEGWK